MVRISGIDLPKSKTIEYALTSVYGIGLTSSRNVLAIAKMEDGTFKSTKATVKVTIGGCGG